MSLLLAFSIVSKTLLPSSADQFAVCASSLVSFGVSKALVEALVALVDDADAGRALEDDVVAAIGERGCSPGADLLGDLDVVGGDAGDVEAVVIGLDAAVEQDDRDLGLLGTLERVLPAGRLGGRQQDDVDALVDERRERVDLRLLVEVGGGCVLELVSGVLREGVLDVLLVGLAPRAFGADGDEADGGQLTGAAFAAGALFRGSGRASGETECERADCGQPEYGADARVHGHVLLLETPGFFPGKRVDLTWSPA